MYHKSWDGFQWGPSTTGWEALGGVFNSAPAVVSWAPNRLDIFALGTDTQMYHKYWDGSKWGPSQTGVRKSLFFKTPFLFSTRGITSSTTVIASEQNSQTPGIQEPRKRKKADHKILQWEALGGVFNSMPAVTSWGPNRIDIFGLGSNNAMFHKSWDGNSWQPSQTGWDSQGGTFSSAPAVTSWGLNRIDIFDLGSAINDMQHRA
jgi:hypothetical protein